jgi:bifunctional pyridoxal-dependent enzyme with beta-cystathionase and maltose regulon repressor activities
MEDWDIKSHDTLHVLIAEMEVASTSMREAQKALENSLLEVCCGYQDISAQISEALTQSEAALEGARRKREQLEPQTRL